MTQVVDIFKEIEYPSKYDIIPIHNSDRATFKFCRRQFAWSSPAHGNLIRRSSIHGIYEPFWFGGGIHDALRAYYDPILSEDPATVWLTWFDLQWHGGTIFEHQLKEFVDRNPECISHSDAPDDTMYKVDGLKDIIPFGDNEETIEHFMMLRDLGRGMMEFYKSYAEANDNFDVVAVEHDFSVPILSPEGKPLYMVDNRDMPENWDYLDEPQENIYGPLYKYVGGRWLKQVHARGRMDIIVRDRDSGRYGIRDYKTSGKVPDEDYFRHLELDEQCTSYLSYGEVEAKVYDLPYKELDYIDYVAIFKGYPSPPTITSRGFPSLDRSKESTTAAMFEATVEIMSEIDPTIKFWFEHDQKAQSYYSWLLEIGDKKFIWSTTAWRNRTQRVNAMQRVYYEALDMLDPNLKFYPNPTKNYSCLNCAFRAPCIAAETGADFKSIIDEGFIKNWDR